MDINPADLILLAHVIEEGGFTKAAQRLELPNSTVSRRIAALEEKLGERLLTRTTRKMVVTDFGNAVLRHAQHVLAEVESVVSLTEVRRSEPQGLLRISMPGDLTPDMIGTLLADFVDRYPEVTLDVDVSQRRVDIIGENYDLALRIGQLQDDATLVARQIGLFRTALYAAPGYIAKAGPVRKPEDLMGRKILKLQARGEESKPWTLQKGKRTWEGFPPLRAVANSPNVLANMALSGAGVTRLATHFAERHVRSGELVGVLDGWEAPSIPVWAVFAGRKLLPSRTRVFVDTLIEKFKSF